MTFLISSELCKSNEAHYQLLDAKNYVLTFIV